MIRICSHCSSPTFFDVIDGQQTDPSPGAAYGRPINHLPADVEAVYDEARRAMSIRAFTSASLACRKLLMHVAVDKIPEAKPGESFLYYVEKLDEAGYIPPGGKAWLDYVRTSGNEATHEIVLRSREEAEGLLDFVAFLLTAVYDFPARVPGASPSDDPASA